MSPIFCQVADVAVLCETNPMYIANLMQMIKYKLAGHHMRRYEWDSAQYATSTLLFLHLHKLTLCTSVLLVQCDEYYKTSPDYFKGMRVRVQFHLFNVYTRQGNRFHALDAGSEA